MITRHLFFLLFSTVRSCQQVWTHCVVLDSSVFNQQTSTFETPLQGGKQGLCSSVDRCSMRLSEIVPFNLAPFFNNFWKTLSVPLGGRRQNESFADTEKLYSPPQRTVFRRAIQWRFQLRLCAPLNRCASDPWWEAGEGSWLCHCTSDFLWSSWMPGWSRVMDLERRRCECCVKERRKWQVTLG